MGVPVTLSDVYFQYATGDFRLRIPRWEIRAGESVAVIGPSGSGKTTLLHLVAGILTPRTGKICIGERNLCRLTDAERRRFRLGHLGLVFQEFELLEYLTVWDNLLLPCRLHPVGRANTAWREQARQLAERLGLADKLHRFPRALSQGERQRIAIGRALLFDPQLILADEPTGNLDPANKKMALELLCEKAKSGKATVLVATHDYQLLEYFDKTVAIEELVEWTIPQVPRSAPCN